MTDRAYAMVMASFTADSLALGAHWIYDTAAISKHFGRVEALLTPLQNSFHATKDAGEFTHYGDQAFVLLQSLVAQKGFSISDFSGRWQKLFKNYNGYVDQATQGTLARWEAGSSPEAGGSPSDDLAGAARIAPLVYVYSDNLEKLIETARAQTQMTHTNPLTVESAGFFAEVAFRVLEGLSPRKAILETASSKYSDSPLFKWITAGLQSAGDGSVQAIARFGQTCHTPEAFPGVIHLIAKYEDDLKEGLIQSVMAGGDSAARGMMVGMVLGAHLGLEALPEDWVSGLKRNQEISKLLQDLI